MSIVIKRALCEKAIHKYNGYVRAWKGGPPVLPLLGSVRLLQELPLSTQSDSRTIGGPQVAVCRALRSLHPRPQCQVECGESVYGGCDGTWVLRHMAGARARTWFGCSFSYHPEVMMTYIDSYYTLACSEAQTYTRTRWLSAPSCAPAPRG